MVHFQVKQKGPIDKVGTGSNTEIYMDGVKLNGITKFNFTARGRGINEISMELVGTIEIEQNIDELSIKKNLITQEEFVKNPAHYIASDNYAPLTITDSDGNPRLLIVIPQDKRPCDCE